MSAPAQFRRQDWRAADVEKWNARIEQILSMHGVPENPPPVDWDAVNRDAMDEWKRDKASIVMSRIPEKFRHAEPRHDLSGRWLAAYRDGRLVNLLICGPTRVGKTWELMAIARQLLQAGTPVVVETVTDMLQALRPNEDGASDIGQYQTTPVLGMDDLGGEKSTEWTNEQLYRIADYRHNRNLPTIVTSNLPPAALEQRYDPRLIGRLFENAGTLTIRQRPPQVPARFEADL
jgi:IstB-like ATP binding protein